MPPSAGRGTRRKGPAIRERNIFKYYVSDRLFAGLEAGSGRAARKSTRRPKSVARRIYAIEAPEMLRGPCNRESGAETKRRGAFASRRWSRSGTVWPFGRYSTTGAAQWAPVAARPEPSASIGGAW